MKKQNTEQLTSLQKLQKKLLSKFRKYKRGVKAIAQMEAKEAIKSGLRIAQLQLKIRPRIRLFSRVIIILALTLFASSKALAYIKPHEADLKINGQAILVAESKPAGQSVNDVEIIQNIQGAPSPFSFEKPVDHGYVSQGYSFYHPAFDVATDLGTPIHPVGSGIVSFAGFEAGGKGNVVVVDHGDGLKTLYAHMGKIYVGVGNVVNAKSEIGTVGLTGRTTGPHVHFEVHDHDVPVNPGNFLPSN